MGTLSSQGKEGAMKPDKETIETAAIRVLDGSADGEIFTGRAHANIMNDILNADRCDTEEEHARYVRSEMDNGFLTSAGRFVDRDVAYIIAKEAGQLIEENSAGHLMSYDLKKPRRE